MHQATIWAVPCETGHNSTAKLHRVLHDQLAHATCSSSRTMEATPTPTHQVRMTPCQHLISTSVLVLLLQLAS